MPTVGAGIKVGQSFLEALAREQSGHRITICALHGFGINLVQQTGLCAIQQRDIKAVARPCSGVGELILEVRLGDLHSIARRAIDKAAMPRRLAHPDQLHRHPFAINLHIPPVANARLHGDIRLALLCVFRCFICLCADDIFRLVESRCIHDVCHQIGV